MTENELILVERYYRYRVSRTDGKNKEIVEDNLSYVDAWLLHDWLHLSPCSLSPSFEDKPGEFDQ